MCKETLGFYGCIKRNLEQKAKLIQLQFSTNSARTSWLCLALFSVSVARLVSPYNIWDLVSMYGKADCDGKRLCLFLQQSFKYHIN